MGLLSRFFKPRPRPWGLPASQYVKIGEIDKAHDRTLPIKSRSNPGNRFDVNLFKLTCTCPGFRNDRCQWGQRDIRRVCPHLAEAMRETKLDLEFSPLIRLIIHRGRRHQDFFATADLPAKAQIIFGYAPKSAQVGVFALVEEREYHCDYDLEKSEWIGGAPPAVDRILLRALDRVFYGVAEPAANKPRAAPSPKPPRH